MRPDKTIASLGYNGFPRHLSDDAKLYECRETKLNRTVHAEVNAILNAHGPVKGHTLFVTLCPCSACALLVIQSGIRGVVAATPSPELQERWKDSFAQTELLFDEAGIEYSIYDMAFL